MGRCGGENFTREVNIAQVVKVDLNFLKQHEFCA